MTSNQEGTLTETRAVKSFFDKQAQDWDKRYRQDPKKLRQILRVCDLKPGQRILDVACGTGVLIPWLMAYRPSLLMGIDISDGMTEIARKKYRDKRLRIVTADYYHLEAGAFDRIIVYNSYPHFFDKERFAAKTYALLAAGGRFVVAHSKDGLKLNAMLKGCEECSLPLKPAAEESRWFEPYFEVDCIADTDSVFMLSGTKGRQFRK